MEEVFSINRFAIEDYMPEKTIFLSVSMETGQKRMNLRGDKNRLDLEKESFHKKVREGYGKIIHPTSNNSLVGQEYYEGEWKNGKPKMMGSITSKLFTK